MWHADRLNEKRKSDTAAAATAGRIGEDDLAIPKLRPSRSSSDIARGVFIYDVRTEGGYLQKQT